MTNLELAKQILEKLSGSNNVVSFANCMTRLRVKVKDVEKVDISGLKKLEGVLGVVEDETIQVVIGPGKVKKVADEFGKLVGIQGNSNRRGVTLKKI